nr:hypothetical protein [Tanacetum cinerariifolium]
MLLVVPMFLLVLLVHAVGLVPTGSGTISAEPSEIIATIDGNEVVVTESLIRTQLQLNDVNGLYEFTLHDVLDGMRDIRTYNFFRFILDGMIGNIRPTFDFTAKLFSNMKLNWDGPHMPLLAPMLVVPVSGDGADAIAAATHDVPPPSPPSIVPPTHSSSSTQGPSSTPQATFMRPPSPPPYPRSEEGCPTTSTRPPIPTRKTSFQEDFTTAAGGAEDSVVLTDLSLKLDRCINRVTTLENELGVTKKVLGGAVLKLVSRVKRLEGLLQQRKRRLVLSDSEGEEAATKEQDIDLDALHRLASTSLGGDSTVEAAYTIYKASQDAHASSNAGPTADEGILVAPSTILADSTPIPAGSSMDLTVQAAAAAPSSTILAVDKGKAPMDTEDSLPADLLTKQEWILKNLHDYQLREDLAKKLHAEQEAEYARQQEELAQKAQAESVASPAEPGTRLSDQRRRELDAAQLIYTEADWTTFKPTPSLEAPSAKRARQKVYQDVHVVSSQVPASVLAAPSTAVAVSSSAAPSIHADVSVSAAPSVHADAEVGAAESHLDDTQTASEHISTEHTTDESTPSSSRIRRKQIAKKRVTPIVDIADDAWIKFDSASDSDDDPLPYAPYAGWEMVPSPLGSIHAYYDMKGHTKHFTSLFKLLHMVEKNDLRKLLGAIDNLYQSWHLYPYAQVYVLETVDGRVIYMFVNVFYPLSQLLCSVTQNWMVITFHVPFWNDKWLVYGGMALDQMLLFYDPAVLGVAAVWFFTAVLFCLRCWNNNAILALTSEDLSRMLKLTLSNSRLGEDCWELQN